jgi:hypothetical protein
MRQAYPGLSQTPEVPTLRADAACAGSTRDAPPQRHEDAAWTSAPSPRITAHAAASPDDVRVALANKHDF